MLTLLVSFVALKLELEQLLPLLPKQFLLLPLLAQEFLDKKRGDKHAASEPTGCQREQIKRGESPETVHADEAVIDQLPRPGVSSWLLFLLTFFLPLSSNDTTCPGTPALLAV